MISSIVSVGLSSYAWTIIPWFLPVTLFWINEAIMAEEHFLHVLIVSVWGSVLGITSIWLLRILYQKKIIQSRPQRSQKKKTHIHNFSQRITKKLSHTTNKWIIMACIIIGTASVIHDVFIVEIARKKVSFWEFFFAVVIGKTILYAPLIIGWKSLTVLIMG